jgi:asparagine synthase (glutamine-hydrolysing)
MAKASTRPVKTFTTGFGGQVGNFLDERPFAREVSQQYGTEHREFEVQPAVEEALDVALEAFDEPFADDSLIPTHHICQLCRQHVTVALTGLGGDENFAGYERYLGFRLSTLGDSAIPKQILRLAAPLVSSWKETRNGHYRINHMKRFFAATELPVDRRWQRYLTIVPQDERRQLYTPEIARQIDFEAVDGVGFRYFNEAPAHDPLDRALYQDLKLYLPDDILALTDRVGMWHSLELRVPFIDHTLVEFCARIPGSLKLRLPQGEKKHLLRRVARPLLPASVLDHRKQGFAAPMAMWLRGSMRAFTEAALAPTVLGQSGVLDPTHVRQRVEDHQARRALNDKFIFAVLMFQRWWRQQHGAAAIAGEPQAASLGR